MKNTYDNQNRLTERTAKEKKTGKETVHTYRYNAYGDVTVQDDTQFVYGDVSGQVTKETTKLTKNLNFMKFFRNLQRSTGRVMEKETSGAIRIPLCYMLMTRCRAI